MGPRKWTEEGGTSAESLSSPYLQACHPVSSKSPALSLPPPREALGPSTGLKDFVYSRKEPFE